MNSYINDNSKPVIFLGTSDSMLKLVEVCEDHEIKIAGIIDDNYFGNTEIYYELPVIDSEKSFADPEKLKYYKDNYNFFCVVHWSPEHYSFTIANREKRENFIKLINDNNLNCISLVDRFARTSRRSVIGKNVYIDANVCLEPLSKIGDFTSIYFGSIIGHHTTLGVNCLIQRQCIVVGHLTLKDQVYFGPGVRAMKNGATFEENSFVKGGIYIRRGTVKNEIVSMTSSNQKGLVHQTMFE